MKEREGDNMYGAKNLTIDLPCGAQMYCARFGRGTKTLVMIPGLNTADMQGSAGRLAYFYRRFAKDFTVFIFDRRSGRDEGASIKSMADDLAAAMQSCGIEGAYVLGVSQGGMIAQYLAQDYPQLVKKLVLGVTAARTDPLMLQALDEWIGLAEKDDIKGVVTASYKYMYTQKQMKKYKLMLPVIMRFTRFMSTQRFADHARAIYTMDGVERLKRIKCPTLVLGAAQDKITTPEASKEIAQHLKCKCFIFAHEGHAAYLCRQFNKMVYDFFSND